MQDVLLKYGMLLVSLVLVLAIAYFGFNALKLGEPTLEYEQQVSGTSSVVIAKLFTLCGRCVQDSSQSKECFILKVHLSDEVFSPPETLPTQFTLEQQGNWANPQAFRIENDKGICVVRGLG